MFLEASQQLAPLDVTVYQVSTPVAPALEHDDGVRKTLERSQRPSRWQRRATLAVIAWHETVRPALATRRAKKFVAAALGLAFVHFAVNSSLSPLNPAFDSLCRSLDERSYFLLEEDSQLRPDMWSHPAALQARPDGWIELKEGLSLYQPSSNHVDYEFAFEGMMRRGVLGWVVRAADEKNYYAFKLTRQAPKGREKRPVLLRYSVVEGAVPALEKQQVFPLAMDLEENKLYRVRVHAAGDRVTTLIDERGVNSFSDSAHRRGGVGFLGDRGENGLIRAMSVSGNDDTTGRAIYWMRGINLFVSKPRPAGSQLGAAGD